MPAHHQPMVAVQGLTVEHLLSRGARVGVHTHQAASRILHSSICPEQNYKACNAMLLLKNKYSRERLEAACLPTANIIRTTLRLIPNILAAGLDQQPLLFATEDKSLLPHRNIRGSEDTGNSPTLARACTGRAGDEISRSASSQTKPTQLAI